MTQISYSYYQALALRLPTPPVPPLRKAIDSAAARLEGKEPAYVTALRMRLPGRTQ